MIFISSAVPFDQIPDTHEESQTSGKITDYDREVIKEKDFIFGEKDIEKMFDSFRENNFKKNPVYEYVLENEK